jgi:hypothetical protein
MVPSVFTPVLALWYLLFLHLFWQYGTFCFYTCSGSMVPSVFTTVLALWCLLFLHLFWQYGTFCFYTCSGIMVPSVFTDRKNRRYHNARTGVKTEGTILPEQV